MPPRTTQSINAKVLVAKRMIDALGRGRRCAAEECIWIRSSRSSGRRTRRCLLGPHRDRRSDAISRIVSLLYYVIPDIDVGVRLFGDGEGGSRASPARGTDCKPGGLTMLERGAITTEQIRAEELLRTDPSDMGELRRQRWTSWA